MTPDTTGTVPRESSWSLFERPLPVLVADSVVTLRFGFARARTTRVNELGCIITTTTTLPSQVCSLRFSVLVFAPRFSSAIRIVIRLGSRGGSSVSFAGYQLGTTALNHGRVCVSRVALFFFCFLSLSLSQDPRFETVRKALGLVKPRGVLALWIGSFYWRVNQSCSRRFFLSSSPPPSSVWTPCSSPPLPVAVGFRSK